MTFALDTAAKTRPVWPSVGKPSVGERSAFPERRDMFIRGIVIISTGIGEKSNVYLQESDALGWLLFAESKAKKSWSDANREVLAYLFLLSSRQNRFSPTERERGRAAGAIEIRNPNATRHGGRSQAGSGLGAKTPPRKVLARIIREELWIGSECSH